MCVSNNRRPSRCLTPAQFLVAGVLPWLALYGGQLANAGEAAEERAPNVIIILCDNLGYGDIQPFGSQLNRTPYLNQMAREGRRFTHFCVTAGVCTPSRASLMTGCYAQRIGMHDNPRDGQVLRPLSPYGLHPEETTIGEVCQRQGYRTALIGKWHLGDQPEFLPTRQGFELFLGIPYSDDMTQEVGQRLGGRFDGHAWPPLPLMRNEQVIEAPVDRNLLTQRYTAAALEFISDSDSRPFLLLLSHAMPGSTATPFASADFRGKSRSGPWGDAVEELDWSTGQILTRVRELGMANRTLVIWTSDNGAPLSAKAEGSHRGSNAPLHGRGYTTAEGAFRVPTIMWWPGQIAADSVCHELCTTLDLLPTVAALAGANDVPMVDGYDIRHLLVAQPESSTVTSPYRVFAYYERDQLQAVRSGRWKLFLPLATWTQHPHLPVGAPPRPLLFDVVSDVACEHDQAAAQPEVVQRLSDLAAVIRADLGDRGQPGAGTRPAGRVETVRPASRQP